MKLLRTGVGISIPDHLFIENICSLPAHVLCEPTWCLVRAGSVVDSPWASLLQGLLCPGSEDEAPSSISPQEWTAQLIADVNSYHVHCAETSVYPLWLCPPLLHFGLCHLYSPVMGSLDFWLLVGPWQWDGGIRGWGQGARGLEEIEVGCLFPQLPPWQAVAWG